MNTWNMSPDEREDERLEYQKQEYQNTPIRYRRIGAKYADYMTCKTCGFEYWDCMCPQDDEGRILKIDRTKPRLVIGDDFVLEVIQT